jgi:putative pre-16S rRNA nuclease
LRKKRILALDPGERRTGIAGTDSLGMMAFPLTTLVHKGFESLPKALAPIIEERDPQILVVGLPLDSQGLIGPQAKKVLVLVEALKKAFPLLEVLTQDESHSTDIAHTWLKDAGMKAAKRKTKADTMAALAILKRYMGEI